MIPDLLHDLHPHSFPSLHYLSVGCVNDSAVRALTTFLPQCTNLLTLHCECISLSEIVEEEMWEAAVRRCRNLEEVRVDGDNTDVSAKRLESVLRKLSDSAGIHALKLRRIVELDLKGRVMEEYTE